MDDLAGAVGLPYCDAIQEAVEGVVRPLVLGKVRDVLLEDVDRHLFFANRENGVMESGMGLRLFSPVWVRLSKRHPRHLADPFRVEHAPLRCARAGEDKIYSTFPFSRHAKPAGPFFGRGG